MSHIKIEVFLGPICVLEKNFPRGNFKMGSWIQQQEKEAQQKQTVILRKNERMVFSKKKKRVSVSTHDRKKIHSLKLTAN